MNRSNMIKIISGINYFIYFVKLLNQEKFYKKINIIRRNVFVKVLYLFTLLGKAGGHK